jgi:hypothetical protein
MAGRSTSLTWIKQGDIVAEAAISILRQKVARVQRSRRALSVRAFVPWRRLRQTASRGPCSSNELDLETGANSMISLRNLPVTLRALFSCFLIIVGIGYLTALAYLFLVDVEPHRTTGQGVVEGIGEKYHGSTGGTRLEAALKGTMADKLTPEERDQVLQWIRAGATRDGYAKIAPVLTQKCGTCHSAQSGLPISPLTSFEDVQKLTKTDTGLSLLQLARVSHVHLFGISVLFLLTGAIFSLSETPTWFRVVVLVVPYLAIVMDIGSWWATKYYDPVFAYVVLMGGAFMGLALACQILLSLWEMWIGRLNAFVGTNRGNR